jgi:GTP-binding protein HflX
VKLADLLVHVVDGTSPDPEAQIEAVRVVLDEIGASSVPELVVVNKCDASDEAARLAEKIEGAVAISAATGEGLDVLLRTVADRLRVADRVVMLTVPWARGDVLAAVHREGEVVEQVAGEDAATLYVVLDDVGRARFAPYISQAS